MGLGSGRALETPPPWAYHLQHILCGDWEPVNDGVIRSTATAYRWVSQFGGQLVPVAALFGVVRSSGVVGMAEKWVRVHIPGRRGYRWMYVSVAVDGYTYSNPISGCEAPCPSKTPARWLKPRAMGYPGRLRGLDSLRRQASQLQEPGTLVPRIQQPG